MVHLVDSTAPSPTKGTLQTYAKDISAAVETMSTYCTSEGLPQPSFDPQAPSVTIPSTAPLVVQDARQKLIASAAGIQQLVTEPAEYLPNLAIHYQHLSCLRWLNHFNILNCIPLHGSISYSVLARTTNVPELQLRSVVRMAITSNFLCEPIPDNVAHNAVSALFVNNPRLVDWARFMTQFSMPTAAAFVEATEKWGVTDKKNETAFNVATNTSGPLFEYFAQSPELANCFASYMKSVQASYGTSLKHLLTGFYWAGLGEALIVDVGGSTCSSSIALAEAFPKLRFVVMDLPDTISNAPNLLSAHPESISSRISTRSYDFFTPQLFKGADVYLLRMILHDWPHTDALLILKNHLEALKANPNARMVIMDTVLPLPGSISTVEEALLRVRDLTMIQSFNSKERELGEFTELFSQACDQEGSLVLRNIVKPPGSSMSVMEVGYQPYRREGKVPEVVNGNGATAGVENGSL